MRIRLLLLALVAIVGCSEHPTPVVDPRVTDATRPLVFLTHPTDPPCSYLDDHGECVGTNVDLARRIAAKMGRPLVCETANFEDLIPRLKAGTADLAIATITITQARRRDVDFSVPYQWGGNCFLYRADGPRPHMSEISSLRIGAESGTTGDLYLCLHGCDPVRFTNIKEAVGALDRGEVDALFFDATPLKTLATQSNGSLVASPLVTREGYGVAVDKRRPDVLAAANAVIAEEGGLK